MADKYLVGIIQVPLSTFTMELNVGRSEDQKIIEKLSKIFRRTAFQPEKWENHIKGLIDGQTLADIVSSLSLSYRILRGTVCWLKYPKAHI